jgi:hypothetical protein
MMPSAQQPREVTLIDQIGGLEIGESLSKVEVIPREQVREPDAIYARKRAVTNTVTSAISRVKRQRPGRVYSVTSFHHIKDDFDVVVVVIVTRDQNEL